MHILAIILENEISSQVVPFLRVGHIIIIFELKIGF